MARLSRRTSTCSPECRRDEAYKKERKTEVDFLICTKNLASNSLKLIISIKTIEKLNNHDYYSLQD
jgi:hypothetical protein